MKDNAAFKKRKLDETVSAKVHSEDVELLRQQGVNISKIIQEAISDAARRERSFKKVSR